ncbi:MAG: type II 3-dehydroquinate dehydratase [Fidelibacterota bacterium]
MMNILVINGPNLNLLGEREPEIYGRNTLEELMMWLEKSPEATGHYFKFYQSNHEGEIINTIHDERHWADGIIINPAAFSHYSYAIRDAISAVAIPTVEVHLSDIHHREEFRQMSVISKVCIDQISGLGKDSYREGLKVLLEQISEV